MVPIKLVLQILWVGLVLKLLKSWTMVWFLVFYETGLIWSIFTPTSVVSPLPKMMKLLIIILFAPDFYLLGTVMLVFGMGLYELFISNLDIAKVQSEEKFAHRSNLFGLFTLKVSLMLSKFT